MESSKTSFVLHGGDGEAITAQPSLFHLWAWLEIQTDPGATPSPLVLAGDQLRITAGGKPFEGAIVPRRGRLALQPPPMDGDTMLKHFCEAADAVRAAYGGRIPRPEGMSHLHWEALRVASDVAYGVVPSLCKSSACDALNAKFREVAGYPRNGPLHPSFGSNSRHDVHVAYALAEGSREVLLGNISAILDRPSCNDLWFAPLVARYPYLRGLFRSVDELCIAARLLSWYKLDISPSESEARRVAALLATLPGSPSEAQADDVLFQHGVLPPLPPLDIQHEVRTADDSQLVDEVAVDLARRFFAAYVKQQADKQRRDAENQPERCRIQQQARITALQAQIGTAVWNPKWAMKVATALAKKDVALLVQILDDSNNETTQRFCEDRYGVKLRNVSAAKRRLAAFAVAGVNDVNEIDRYERLWANERESRKAAMARARVVEKAEEQTIRFEGQIVTGRAYVETLIHRGFTAISSFKRGAAKEYWLRHPASSDLAHLSVGAGTLAYAQLRLDELSANSGQSLKVA